MTPRLTTNQIWSEIWSETCARIRALKRVHASGRCVRQVGAATATAGRAREKCKGKVQGKSAKGSQQGRRANHDAQGGSAGRSGMVVPSSVHRGSQPARRGRGG